MNYVFLFLNSGSESIELCRQYSIGNLMYNSFYCLDYCCGNCNFRYCCSNDTYLVNQNKCKNNVVQLHLDWYKFTSKKSKTENLTNITTKATTVSSNLSQ